MEMQQRGVPCVDYLLINNNIKNKKDILLGRIGKNSPRN